jgi:hypothetical protein
MSDKNKLQIIENQNERISWIEEAISKKYIKYYEYKDFSNIQKIGHGQFGKVYRANWKNSEQYFTLKSLFNLNNDSVMEIIREVIIKHKYNVYYMDIGLSIKSIR